MAYLYFSQCQGLMIVNKDSIHHIHLHRGKVKEVDLRNHLQDYGYRLGGDSMNTRATLK